MTEYRTEDFTQKIVSCLKNIHIFEVDGVDYVFKKDSGLILKGREEIRSIFLERPSLKSFNDAEKAFLKSLDKIGYFRQPISELQKNFYKRCHLYLDYSNKCNLKCSYCYVDKIAPYQLPISQAVKNIEIFVNRNKRLFSEFVIDFCCFGEPLHFFKEIKKINRITEELSENSGRLVKLIFTTNGTLFSNEMIKYFIERKQQFGISLDGDEETHDSSRPNSYKKIKRNIHLFFDNKTIFNNVWISTVINRVPEDLFSILDHHINLGFKTVIMKISRKLLVDPKITSLKSCYWNLVSNLLIKYKEGDLRPLSAIMNVSDYFGKYLRLLIRNERILQRCGAGRQLFLLNKEGILTPCLQFHGDFFLKIGEASKKINTSKITFLEEKECKICWAQTLCGGCCYYLKKAYPDHNLVSCDLQKSLIEYAVYLIDQMAVIDPRAFRKLSRIVSLREKVFLGSGD